MFCCIWGFFYCCICGIVVFCCIWGTVVFCCIWGTTNWAALNPANLSSVQSFARALTYKGKIFYLKNMTLKFKENISISQRNIKESIQSFPCPVVCASSNIQRSLVPIPTPLQILISQIRKQISESTQSFHPPTIQPNQPNKQTKMKNCGKKSSLNTLTRRI